MGPLDGLRGKRKVERQPGADQLGECFADDVFAKIAWRDCELHHYRPRKVDGGYPGRKLRPVDCHREHQDDVSSPRIVDFDDERIRKVVRAMAAMQPGIYSLQQGMCEVGPTDVPKQLGASEIGRASCRERVCQYV